jgi:hypothetical protein
MNKIGPNDPCHCGSGKKLKKCCIVQIRVVNINTPAKRIAGQVVKLWNRTTNNPKGITADMELGQLRIAEFETYPQLTVEENLPVEGEPLKIDRKIVPPILSKHPLLQQFGRQ